MDSLFNSLKKTPVFYVTRDAERAYGLPDSVEHFYIITNQSPDANQSKRKHIIEIPSDTILDTWELLEHPYTKKYLLDQKKIHKKINIVVFKNTKKIEDICKEYDWTLLNPKASLARTIEEKISQIEWLGTLEKYLPQYMVETLANISWNAEPFILQFNRAHTGQGTILIESEGQLVALKKLFPKRPVRISEYLEGPTYTVNAVVGVDDIIIGNISYQITGQKPFTTLPFATIGNDWAIPYTQLSYTHQSIIKQMAHDIGMQLKRDQWKGAFGIDVIHDLQTNTIKLIEINARQPASVSWESQLQHTQKTKGRGITLFEAHLCALLNLSLLHHSAIPLQTGAQLIYRKQSKNIDIQKVKKTLTDKGYVVIEYANEKKEYDLLRIQSTDSFMNDAYELNSAALSIATLL